MQAVLIIIHLFVAVSLIFVVLLQRSEGGALGMGGGGSGLGGLFSPRGATSTLTRTTAILALLFFLTSMALTWLALGARQPSSILNQTAPGGSAPAAPSNAPALPVFPAVPTPGTSTPAAPATAPPANPAPSAPAPQTAAPAAPAPSGAAPPRPPVPTARPAAPATPPAAPGR